MKVYTKIILDKNNKTIHEESYDYSSCYDSSDQNLKPYFKAAIKNFDITKAADTELRKDNPDMKILGSLMTDHHNLLKDELKNTTDEIDKMIDICNNLGDTKSLAVHPSTTTHRILTDEERNDQNIFDNLVRLSVGLEDFEDIKNDLDQALIAI